MIAWNDLARRLAALASRSPVDSILSVTLALPAMPAGCIPGDAPWWHWQRPDVGLRLTAIGDALKIESAGPGRFAALGAGMNGLRAAWRHDAAAGNCPPPLAFAGFAFAPSGGAPLPNAVLAVPSLLLREEGGTCQATFSCPAAAAADAPQRFRRLWESLTVPASAAAPPRLARRPAPLEDQAFLARSRAALAAIGRGAAEKLVLTRSVAYTTDRAFAPWPVLDALAAANPTCAVWAVGRGDGIFLGASPELLLEMRGGTVAADALAGTAWGTGENGAAPHCLPLGSDKNRREHDLVTDAVAAALAPLCAEVSVPEAPEILQLSNLQHLRRRIAGSCRPGVGAFDLLARLHPTPAVGGSPTAAAREWLATHGDRRGAWYTGGIGWADAAGAADFAVALRCGFMAGSEIALYAGAGFVSGSDPLQELAETEAKLAPMRAALEAGAARSRAATRTMTGT